MSIKLKKFEHNGKFATIVFTNDDGTKIGIKTEFISQDLYNAWKDLQATFNSMLDENTALVGVEIDSVKGIKLTTHSTLSEVIYQKSKSEYIKTDNAFFNIFKENVSSVFAPLLEGNFNKLVQAKQTKLL